MVLRAALLGAVLALAGACSAAAEPAGPWSAERRTGPAAEALAEKAAIALAEGRTREAVERLEDALSWEPNDPQLHFRLGLALCDHVDQVGMLEKLATARRLREEFEEAVLLQPGHVGARIALVEFHRQAPAIVGGSPDEVGRHARELVALEPDEGRLALARMHRKYGELRAAERQLREVLGRRPEHREALVLLAGLALEGSLRSARPDGQFQRVFSMETLYYAVDLDAALAEMLRVLKPGGTADIVIDYYTENEATTSWAEATGVPMHYLGENDWKQVFEKAGFVDVSIQRVRDSRDVGDAECFEPSACYPDFETWQKVRGAGSLWIHAEKPA